jgi:uncharacterized protein (DUF342 family)
MAAGQTTDAGSSTRKPFSAGVTADKMHVVVNIRESQENLQVCAEAIEASLDKLQTAKRLSVEEISNWLSESVDGDGLLQNGILISGTPPVYPIDGRIEWADDFFSTGFQVDPDTGRVDYRKQKGRTTVSNGELLATIIPGVAGQDGKNVFGDNIPVAKPTVAKLVTGENVRREETTDALYAEIEGRIQLNNEKLTVSDVYVISGDVDLASGDIDHYGAIIVEQDVQEGAVIRATGDIEIHGIVEAADVQTDGNLIVYGGICGKEGVSIRAGGEIHAMYILDSHVEAAGDILVAREIVHSQVKTLGAVRVPEGRIVGGTTTALGGIVTGEAGSDACVETTLIPGVDYNYSAKNQEKVDKIAALYEQRDKILASIKPLLAALKSLPPDKRAMVEKLAANAKNLQVSAEALEQELAEAKAALEERAEHSIRVLSKLFPDVKVCIKQEWNKFKQPLGGPLRIECVGAKIRVKSED